MIAKAPSDKVFWVVRGDRIDNLHDLANCIASLSGDQFRHHVNEKKNDFAKWIHDVFNDKKLSKALHKLHDQKQFVKTIREHLT